ncbi:VOC family protein [Nonomuraea soli]
MSGRLGRVPGMAYDFQVTVDSHDPHALADWWAEALGWEVEAQDSAFIRSMIEQGHAKDDDTITHRGALVWKEGAAIRHPEGIERAPRVLFQLVPEDKTVKNRVHLDVRVGADNVKAEVERLVARGATVLHEGQQGPVHKWVTIADPEGNELCIT